MKFPNRNLVFAVVSTIAALAIAYSIGSLWSLLWKYKILLAATFLCGVVFSILAGISAKRFLLDLTVPPSKPESVVDSGIEYYQIISTNGQYFNGTHPQVLPDGTIVLFDGTLRHAVGVQDVHLIWKIDRFGNKVPLSIHKFLSEEAKNP